MKQEKAENQTSLFINKTVLLLIAASFPVIGLPGTAAAGEIARKPQPRQTIQNPKPNQNKSSRDPLGDFITLKFGEKGVRNTNPTEKEDSSDTETKYDAIGEWLNEYGQSYRVFFDEDQEAQAAKIFTPPPAAIEKKEAAAQVSAVMDDLGFKGKCDQFATDKGFGPWGKVIIDEFQNGKANALLQGTTDLVRACPNYNNLNNEERSYVWVSFFASMSFLESSCKPTAKAPGIAKGRVAAGLLQLHKGSEHKYAPRCQKNASSSAGSSLKCGISILNQQINGSDTVFDRNSHWGVLRPQGDLVKAKNGKKRRAQLARVIVGGLKELPLCQNQSASSQSIDSRRQITQR